MGKTGTKDAIADALSACFSVRKSEKSFNSEIGVPLTILGLPNGWNNPLRWVSILFRGFLLVFSKRSTLNAKRFPSWLILEVGADRPNDIKKISEWLHPDVVVVTRLPETPVHIEFFGSREAVILEKGHLVHALKDGGILILNADDNDVLAFRQAVRSAVVRTYGMNEGADFHGTRYEILCEEKVGVKTPIGVGFRLDYAGKSLPVRISGVLGRTNVYRALAAAAVSDALQCNVISALEALTKADPPRGRMRILAGVNHTTIIDDTYNSSPIALHEALYALKDLRTDGRKISVLGDMAELGSFSKEAHLKAGSVAADSCDLLFAVGREARFIAEGALNAGMDEDGIFEYENSVAAGAELLGILHAGDTILVKGSQSMRMERIVKSILADPSRASELLVRQEKEWEKKN